MRTLFAAIVGGMRMFLKSVQFFYIQKSIPDSNQNRLFFGG